MYRCEGESALLNGKKYSRKERFCVFANLVSFIFEKRRRFSIRKNLLLKNAHGFFEQRERRGDVDFLEEDDWGKFYEEMCRREEREQKKQQKK